MIAAHEQCYLMLVGLEAGQFRRVALGAGKAAREDDVQDAHEWMRYGADRRASDALPERTTVGLVLEYDARDGQLFANPIGRRELAAGARSQPLGDQCLDALLIEPLLGAAG